MSLRSLGSAALLAGSLALSGCGDKPNEAPQQKVDGVAVTQTVASQMEGVKNGSQIVLEHGGKSYNINSAIPQQVATEMGFHIFAEQGGKSYIVRKGDTLSKIARNNNTSIQNLMDNNPTINTTFTDNCSPKDIKKSKAGKWCNAPMHTIKPGYEVIIEKGVTSHKEGGGVSYNNATNTLTIDKKIVSENKTIIPEGFKQQVKEAINPYTENDNLAILLDFSGSTGDDRKLISEWTSQLGIPRAEIFGYSELTTGPFKTYNEAEINSSGKVGNGGIENIINAIQKAIDNGIKTGKPVTRIVIMTDEEGDDWRKIKDSFPGVKITTFLINDPRYGANCKNTRYKEIGSCVNVKPISI